MKVQPEPVRNHPTAGMHIWGWAVPDELEWLRETAARMTSVVEIGSLHGRSAFALLTGCPGPVYCIDPWNDEHDLCEASFLSHCGHFENLRAIRGFSPAAIDQVPGEVDMVFIDGDHEYESVIADIKGWLPKTRKVICGHDYNHGGYPGVRKAVNEVFGDRVQPAGEGPLGAIWMVEI